MQAERRTNQVFAWLYLSQGAERLVQIVICVGRRHQRNQRPSQDSQYFLDELVADHASTLGEAFASELLAVGGMPSPEILHKRVVRGAAVLLLGVAT